MFEKMSFNEPKLTPEEEKAHEESERRRKILEKEENKGEVEIKDISDEETEKFLEKIRQRRETNP